MHVVTFWEVNYIGKTKYDAHKPAFDRLMEAMIKLDEKKRKENNLKVGY